MTALPSTSHNGDQPATQSVPLSGSATAATSSRRASAIPTLEAIDNSIRQSLVMIVDDEPISLNVVQRYLSGLGYERFVSTKDSREAVDLVQRHRPDILMLDIMMPHVCGIDVLAKIREQPGIQHTPVLIMTATRDATTKLQALDLGANDFISKPIDYAELGLRVRNTLMAKGYRDHLSGYAGYLEDQVRQKITAAKSSEQDIIHCLARAAEYRDGETGQHVVRVGLYAGLIARALGVTASHATLIEQAAKLHDIGKIGIPDAVLKKPGKLDPEELRLMREHCQFGMDIIQQMPNERHREETTPGATEQDRPAFLEILQLDGSPLLKLAAIIAQSHHEKWDGSGYPQGLRGNEIPLEGRITSYRVMGFTIRRIPIRSTFD